MRLPSCIVLVIAITGCSKGQDHIECPMPQTGQVAGTIQNTSAQIKAAGERLGRGSENEIAEAASYVRATHTAASKTEIINYLVTAYCQKIDASSSLDKTAKQQAMRAFSARAEKIVRSTG